MKKLLVLFVVCGLFSAVAKPALAQGNPAGANAPRYGIAVVDISYVFKNYPRFDSTMKSMQVEMKAAEDQLKAERDQIQTMEQKRNQFAPGSNEFKQVDEQLAHQKADFNIKAGKIRRDFLEREAQVYYETYLEVNRIVELFARNNNIGLVLRFNGEPPMENPTNREDVLRTINQPIVFQNGIDITPDVLTLLNRGASQQAGRPVQPNR